MLSSSVIHTTDVDAHRQALRPADQELLVTGRGAFAATVTKIDLHRLWLQCGTETMPRVWHVELTSRRHGFCFPISGETGLISNGAALQPNTIGILAPDRAHWSVTTRPVGWGSMSLPPDYLGRLGAASVGRDLTILRNALSIAAPAQAVDRLRRLHRAATDLAATAPGIIAVPSAAQAMEYELTDALVGCLGQGEWREDTGGWRRHSAIIRRFRDFLDQAAGDPIYLSNVCTALGVAERTLRACCQAQLGMSPKRYLSLRRLHLARQALAAAPSMATVTEIAMRFGFWELGRFAVEYRSTFGESPSGTLRRAGRA